MIKRKDIKYRVGKFRATPKKTFATFLVYIEARTAMDELDEIYGPENWEFRWERVEGVNFAVKGIMKIKIDDRVLIREDIGYPVDNKMQRDINATEWLKDAISDSVKRCAVQYNVGRFLYDAPFLYTEEVNTYINEDKKVVLNSYNPLTPLGEKMIEGNITKWYNSIVKTNKNEKL